MTPLLAPPRPAPWVRMAGSGEHVAPESVARVVGMRRVAIVAAGLVGLAGALVLLGWVFDVDGLEQLTTEPAPIRPSAAFSFVLTGGGLWLLAHGDMHPRVRIAAAAVVFAIAATTIVGYLFGFGALEDAFEGPMAANSAVAFLLAGGSLALGRVQLGRFWAADVLGFASGAIGLVALVGHAVAAPTYYRVGTLAEMSVPTAICFVMLGGGILLSVPKRGASRLLVSDGPGGALARWLLPAALFTPLFVGLLRWQGQLAGLWQDEAGVVLLLLSCMSAALVVIWLYARSLDQADEVRREAEVASARLAALVDASDDAIVGGDLDATIRTWNRGAERLWGYTAEEAVGMSGGLILAPDVRDMLPQLLDTLNDGQPIEDFEVSTVRQDGTRVEVELTLSPILDCSGETVGISAIARDISDRRRAEQAERLQAEIAQNIEEGVCLVRASDRELLWVNRKFEELFGTAQDGRPLAVLEPAGIAVEDPTAAERIVHQLESGGRAEYDVRSLRDDRPETLCHVRSVSYEHPEHGHVWLSTLEDVTAARRLERERGEALTELERSNAELEQYAYVASHDLGEPLRVVSGFVELLQRRYEGRLDAEADRFIAATLNGVDRMQAIIDALLAYSRVGRAEVARDRVDCAGVAQAAISALQTQINEADAQVNVHELPFVHCDGVLIGQVFQNLISNAVKFRDGEDPVVEIEAEWGRGEWTFSVTDNGVGIDPRNAARVFEMFQRAHGGERPGIGIGLAMCKRIVEKHGGRIWAEARASGGTAMRFSLPDTPAP